jgi:hypothetical protein
MSHDHDDSRPTGMEPARPERERTEPVCENQGTRLQRCKYPDCTCRTEKRLQENVDAARYIQERQADALDKIAFALAEIQFILQNRG